MNTMHTSTPRDPQRCTAPRRLHRRLSGLFRRLHGGLLCALLAALVVGLAPAMMAPAAHATGFDTPNWMSELSLACAEGKSSPTCPNPSPQCAEFPYTSTECTAIDVPLTELAIPGTHDTGTFSIPSTPATCSDNVFAPDLSDSTSTLHALNYTINCPATLDTTLGVAFLVPIPGFPLIVAGGIVTSILAAAFAGLSPTAQPYVDALPTLAGDALFGNGVAPAFTKFARSQDQDVTQMLDGGIRYLDLRVCGSSDGPRICHSIYGEPIMDLVDQVHTWTAAHPKEVVILDFNHFYAMSQADENSLANTIVSTFGSSLIPPTEPSDLTLRALWGQGENVLVSYQDGQVHTDAQGNVAPLWPSLPSGLPPSTYTTGANAFPGLWGNTYDVTTMDTKAQDALQSRCDLTVPPLPPTAPCPDSFYNYGLQLTPGINDIIAGVTNSDSLQAAAARSNSVVIPHFFTTVEMSPTLLQHSVNIVSADFYENSDLVPDVIALDANMGCTTNCNWSF